ncbi:MAG TPA: nuclear transport factor 2 family protein [Terriglobales bacterium]|nr:nuclear transport factor 2 family protein [Terriglobales bacterium]
MKSYFVILFLLICGVFLSTRAATRFTSDGNSAEVEQLRKLELQMCDLLVRGDMEAYGQHVAEDYVRVGSDGSMTTKSDVLRAFQKNPIVAMDPADIQIRVYGEAAVLNIALTFKQQRPQGLVTSRSRITKTFVKHEQHWMLVSLVETPLPQN